MAKKKAKKAAKKKAKKAPRATPKKKVAKKAVRKAPARAAKEVSSTPAPNLSQAFSDVYKPAPAPNVQTVTLDVDIAPHFKSSHAVNEALRALLRIVRQVKT